MINISLKRIGDHTLPIPTFATDGSAAFDLHSAVDCLLRPGDRFLVPTGWAYAIPEDYVGEVAPRSGLAFHHGVSVLNSPGIIDSDYRGQVHALLINHGVSTIKISVGDRIAQMKISKIIPVAFTVVEELDETKRGDGGFGSTGK